MAANLETVKLWSDAVDEFNAHILPLVKMDFEQDGEPDWVARREAWNNWTDMLCKDLEISDWQYENWSQPASCGE
jgi:hypothetical protein